MATAVLRGALVVAALALGVFVLSKAFPSGDGGVTTVTPGGGGGETTISESPSPSPATSPQGGGGGGGGGGGDSGEAREPSEVELYVLNGTDVSGLADSTQDVLEEAGYRVLTVGNAQGGPYETSVIRFKKRFRADAELLRDQFFPGASLEQAAPDAQAQVTVILGDDYAAAQGEN